MLRIFYVIMACSLCLTGVFAQVKVGDNPLEIDDASLIEIESTSKGFLPSRMTTAQRDLQTSWNTGHIIYNLTDSCLQIYSGTAWDCFVKGTLIDSTLYKYDGSLTDNRTIGLNGNSLTFDAAGAQDVIIQSDGDVGIGTTTPNAKLDVENGTVRFSEYGEGDYLSTGLLLGVDADGDIIEIDTTNFVADDQTIDLFQILNDSLLISLEGDNADPLGVDLSDYTIDTSIYRYNGTLTEARTLTLGGYNLTFSGTNNVTFESTGELGVGEPTPNAPIHITESNGTPASAIDGSLILEHSDVGGASSLVFKSSEDEGNDFGYIQYQDDGSGNGSNSENSLLTIGSGNDAAGTAGQDDIAIMPSGNVGIGTTSPEELLHVAGDMRLDGALEDKDGDAGTSGQILTSTATGTDWVDPSTVGTDDQNLSDGGKTDNSQTIDIEDGNSVTFSVADADSSTSNELQTIDLIDLSGTDLRLSLSDDGEVPQTVDLSPLQDGTGTDDQDLSDGGKTGNNQTIDIEDGSSVTFSVADADSSTTNEIQDLTLTGNILAISDDPNTDVDLSPYLDDTTLTQEEVQDFVGSMVSPGNTETGISVEYDDANNEFDFIAVDASATNEIQTIDSFALTGTSLALSLENDGENPLTVDFSSLQDGTGTDDQDLSDGGKTGNDQTIDIEDGNSVTFSVADADSSTTNEIQTVDQLTLSGTDLLLSLENDGVPAESADLSDLQGPWDNLDTTPATQSSTDINYPGGNVGINDADPSERLQVNGNIEAGDDGAGTVALTINDGQGNANVTFNHTRGVPDNNGSSARIVSGVDATTGYLGFEVESNVSAGVSVNTTELMRIQDTGQIRFHEYGDGDFDDSNPSRLLGSTTAGQIVEYELSNITDDQVIDSFALTGTSLALSLESDGENPLTVDLSSLQDGTGSDDQTLTYTNSDPDDNFNTLELEGSAAFNIDDNHLGTINQTLTGARTIGLNSNALTFDGSSRDMVINSAGNVGIGVASPARPLHVDEALRLSRGANSTSFIFDRWNGTIGTTWASAGFFLESNSAGTGEFFISNYDQNVGGDPSPGKAFSIDLATDQLAFPQYGDGTFDDTNISRLLGVNTDGDILELIPELDSFELTGNILAISFNGDGVNPLTVDLSTISGSSDNIYNTNGSLDGARTVNLNTHNLTFDGTGDGDVIIQADGDVGIGTTAPSGDLEVRSNEDQNAFSFIQEDGTTGEKDVFTIEDQDIGGGGQDESSVLKVHKSGAINSGDNGFSLIELANTGADPGANKYWISGRKDDEGKPLWGVDITDNDYWSEGGMTLGVTGVDGGTYSGGTFRVEADGDVGIGTTSPNARLEVDGGSVRLSDYGANTYVDTSVSTLLTVQPDGDVRELNTAKNTRWFYPPAIVIDASALDTMATLDLHADYVDQFGSPLISSDGASGYVPYYLEDELEYYVTDYDTNILRNISIDADGVMTYDVYSVPFDNYTVINVVFVIKDP